MPTSLTVDELVVLINAETKDFKRQVAAINDQLDGISKQSTTMSKKSAAAFGVVAGAAQALVNKGINMITESVGAAAKRVDTLANSNRVFQNMGFSAEVTTKSMDFLNDSILGLPTGLDDAVRGVQALSSVSGDLKDSVKTYKALNDGILAFGGSADMVNGAVLQLSQLPMDGPLDAQTWNSLRQNGLTPVFAAMAKDSHKSISQLKDDFGSGKLTVKDFTKQLQKLDKDGGGGMAALEKQARDATSGIQTGWANMKTAITRGVGDIMKAIGTSNISGALAGIGKSFENGLKDVAGGINQVKDYIDNLSKMSPTEAARTIGQTLGKALSLAFEKISIGLNSVKKFVDSIDWFKVGEYIVTKLIPGFVGGLVAGLGSDQLWSSIWQTVSQHWGAILMGVLAIALAPSKVLGPLTKIIGKIPIIGPLTNWLVNGIRALIEPIRLAFGNVFNLAFTDVGVRALVFIDTLKGVFGKIFGILWKPFELAIKAIADGINQIPVFFTGMMNLVKTIISTSLGVIKDLFVNIFKGIFIAVKTLFAPFTDFFKALFKALGVELKGVPSPFINAFKSAWNGVKGVWSAAGGFFRGVWSAIRGVFSGVGNWFTSAFRSAYYGITGVFSRLTSYFSGLWSRIRGVFTRIGDVVGHSVGAAFKSVLNTAMGWIQSRINGFINSINGIIGTIDKYTPGKLPRVGQVSLPRFASGGVVPEGYPNDSYLARLTSGEVVLNAEQQKRLGGPTQIVVKIGEDTIVDRVIKGINNKSFMTNGTVIEV